MAEAEQQLAMTFPRELRESLRRHDGSTAGGWRGGDLLSLEGIQSERQIWMDLLQGGDFDDNQDHNEHSGQVQPGWWNAGWIPLHADGGGNGYVIDTTPGQAGQVGQVLFMDHEVGPSEVMFSSLGSYLEDVLGELSSGEWVYSGEYDSLISRDELEEA